MFSKETGVLLAALMLLWDLSFGVLSPTELAISGLCRRDCSTAAPPADPPVGLRRELLDRDPVYRNPLVGRRILDRPLDRDQSHWARPETAGLARGV